MTIPMTYSAEVAAALANGRAIVALESTIITHGAVSAKRANRAAGRTGCA